MSNLLHRMLSRIVAFFLAGKTNRITVSGNTYTTAFHTNNTLTPVSNFNKQLNIPAGVANMPTPVLYIQRPRPRHVYTIHIPKPQAAMVTIAANFQTAKNMIMKKFVSTMMAFVLVLLSFFVQAQNVTGQGKDAAAAISSATQHENLSTPVVATNFNKTSTVNLTGNIYYIRGSGGEPWGSSGNINAMNAVFGAPNYTTTNFVAAVPATIFSAATGLVFMDGSDFGAVELNNFLVANITLIENWVAAGGRLLLNAAPNNGGNINLGFGGVLLSYGPYMSPNATATLPGHPIFAGPFTPVVTNYSGTWYAHATLSGGTFTNIMNGDYPGCILGEQVWGSGYVMFGTETTTNWHSPNPQAQNLLQNKLSYVANVPVCGTVVTNTNTSQTFCTIQDAINAPLTLNGHTIVVSAGTYNESLNINKTLNIRGAQADNCAPTRSGAESIINSVNGNGIYADNVILNGFTIQGQTASNSAPGWGYAVYMAPPRSGTQLINNIIKNNIIGSSLANTGATQAVVDCNWFATNNNPGPSSGNAIYTDEFVGGGVISNVLINKNKFSGNNNGGITVSVSSAGSAATGLTITKNIFDANLRAAFLYHTVSSSFSENEISNSTFAGSGDLRIYGGVNNLTVYNNKFIAGAPSAVRISSDGLGATSSNVVLFENSLTGYSPALKAIVIASGYPGTLMATCNWWGTQNSAAIAAQITGSANYSPWLTSGVDNAPASPGFQPAPGTCTGTSPIITCPANVIAFTSTNNPGQCKASNVQLGIATAINGVPPYVFTYTPVGDYNVGTTTITWTVTDALGNTASCTQLVTVMDDEKPVITCPPPITVNNDPGQCYATGIPLGTATATDNCGISTIVFTQIVQYPVGTTVITYTATDIHGNTQTCTQLVTVVDNEKPTITCPPDVTVNNTPGFCANNNVVLGTPTATDNCPPPHTFTNDHPSPIYPVGTTVVTWTVTDAHGNTQTCTQNVTVLDIENPTVSCISNQTRGNNANVCTYTTIGTEFNPASSADNCAVTSTTYTVSGVSTGSGSNTLAGFVFNLGVSTVTWKVQDAAGNSATCSFTVTVNDVTAPTITCPANITQNNDPGICGAVVNYALPTATDNCAPCPTSLAGYTFIGTHAGHNYFRSNGSADWTSAKNAALSLGGNLASIGNAAENAFVATGVAANTWIGGYQHPSNPGYLEPGGGWQWSDATVWSYTNWNGGEPNNAGSEDHLMMYPGGAWNDLNAGASLPYIIEFACGSITITQIGGLPSGATFPVGSTTNTFRATDAAGNSSTCSFTVTVVDNTPPVITCPANITQANDPNTCGAVVNFNVTATDNCGTNAVLILGAPATPSWSNEIKAKLLATAQFTVVDIFNIETGTPTLAQLQAYKAVLVFTDASAQSPVTLGNILASYIDGGGGVVDAVFDNASIPIQGNFNTTTYRVLNPLGQTQGSVRTLGSVVLPLHPIMVGVTTFNGGTSSYLSTSSSMTAGSYVIARYDNNALFLMAKENVGPMNKRRASLNFFPPSIDSRSDFWVASTDGARIMANALTWVGGTGGGGITIVSTPASGSVFPVGTTTVTSVATDAAGNSSTCSFTVTVIDTQAPTVTAPANVVTTTSNDGTGNCNTMYTIGNATFGDNCSATLSWTMTGATVDAGTGQVGSHVYNIGTTTVTFKATDAAGNSATSSMTVIVNDDENPIIGCAGNMTVLNDPGQCFATVTPTPPTIATDNCGPISYSYVLSGATTGSGNVVPVQIIFNMGLTNVTWKITDPSGNSATCVQTVLIVDAENPIITCVANQVRSTNNNVCTYTTVGTEFNPTFSDNCSATIAYTVTGATTGSGSTTLAGFVFNKGVSTVTWKATDPAGNSATCSFTVTVNDNQNPTVTCVGNQTRSTNNNVCTYTTSGTEFNPTSGGDNCAITSTTYTVTGATTGSGSGSLAGFIFAKGISTVTWKVMDAAGNSATCSFTVTVNDNQNPTIACVGNQVRASNTNVCTYTTVGAEFNPTASGDNCAITSTTYTVTGATTGSGSNTLAGFVFNNGTSTVTWKVMDAAGNSATCSFTVTVNDNQNPTISCVVNQTRSTNNNVCTYTTVGTEFNPTASGDNCGVTSTTYIVSGATTGSGSNTLTGFVFNKGTSTVIWKVMDASGNSATCSFTVQVNDNQKPTITCPANVTVNNTPGQCGNTNVNIGTPTTADNCPGPLVVTNNHPSPSYPVGVTIVTWTVTDVSGNTQTCTQTVTVVDNQKPTITCAGNMIAFNDPTKCYATVTLTPPLQTGDNCPGPLVVTNNAPVNNQYPVGVTTVTWTVTDVAGNTQTCTQNVTVIDNEKPVITCPGALIVENDPGMCSATITLFPATATDNCGILSIVNNHPSTTYPVGTTIVTWTATDIHGNTQTCTQSVTVWDVQNPTISCVGNQTRSTNNNVCTYTTVGSEFNPTASGDNCAVTSTTYTVSGATTGSGSNTLAGFVFQKGISTVTWKVMDAAGNSATCSFTVTVNDNQNPTISCVGNQARPSNTNACTYTTVGAEFNPTASGDNCAVTSTTYTVSGATTGSGSNTLAGFVFNNGTSTVIWKVMDAAGNSATCSFTVTVNDNQNPTITCPGNQTRSTNNNVCTYSTVGTEFNATTGDNCAVTSTTYTVSGASTGSGSGTLAGFVFAKGVSTVSWKVMDAAGNSATCSFTVTVNDNQKPTITCAPNVTVGNNSNQCFATVILTAPTVSDNCPGPLTVTNNAPVNNQYPGGVTTVTWTVTDASGNTQTCTQTVTVTINTTITSSVIGVGGTISPLGNTVVPCGGNQSYTMTANAGYVIGDIIVDGVSINPTPGITTSTYTFTNVTTNHTIAVSFKQIVTADPALVDVYITDMSNNPINTNLIPFNTVNKVKVRVQNLSFTTVPSGTVTVRVQLGNKLNINPGFNFATAGLNNEFTWSLLVATPGAQVIQGVQNAGVLAELPALFDQTASFDVISGPIGSSRIDADILTTNHNNATQFLVDANLNDNHAEVNPYHVLNPFIITSVTSTNVSCYGGSNGTITVTVTGGAAPYDFSKDNGATYVLAQNSPYTFTGLAAGNYNIRIRDAVNQVVIHGGNPVVITQPPLLTATASGTNVSCNGGSNGTATVTPAGGTPGYTYLWSPGGQTTQSISGLAPGTYSVTVTDSKGCTATSSYTVTQPPVLAATTSGTSVSCNGGNNGTATVTPTGGTAPYTYLWSPGGQTTQTISGLAAGTYSVTVTDSKGCTITVSYTVTQPAVLVATASGTNVSCNGGNDGTATVSVTGGTAPYTYLWSPGGATTQSISGLAPGTYSVTVTDSKGCTATSSYTVTQPPLLTIAVTGFVHLTNACVNNGSITVTAGGGTPNYQYAIDAGSYSSPTGTTFTFTGLGSGLHTMYVKDSKGCIKSTTFTLTEPTISNLSLGSDINDNFFATNGEIEPIVYNISEINGKTASPVVLRVYKPSGYNILFSPSDVTVTIGFPGTTYALDNANWTRTDNIPGGYSEFTRNAPLPCFNLKNLKISLQRATLNKTLFNLNAVLFPAATEVDFSSNTNSITFVGN